MSVARLSRLPRFYTRQRLCRTIGLTPPWHKAFEYILWRKPAVYESGRGDNGRGGRTTLRRRRDEPERRGKAVTIIPTSWSSGKTSRQSSCSLSEFF